jgi:hypothetical protein
MTRTILLLIALVAFMVGAVIPLGRLFHMYNIEQVPRMCGTPGDYQPCKVQP